MKNTVLLLILFSLLFFSFSCSDDHQLFKLYEEVKFSTVQQNFIFKNYLSYESPSVFTKGWSYLNNKHNRIGKFPYSLIIFELNKIIPITLYLQCKSIQKPKNFAGLLTLWINDIKLTTEQINTNKFKEFQFNFDPDHLITGKNTIRFQYTLSNPKNIKKKNISRTNAVLFNKLFLTSLSKQKVINAYLKSNNLTRQLKKKPTPKEFIQNVPSQIDFFFDLPEKSELKTHFHFIPLFPLPEGTDCIRFEFTAQSVDNSPKLIKNLPLPLHKSKKELIIKLDKISGLTKLSFKASIKNSSKPIQGIIKWTDTSIWNSKKPIVRITEKKADKKLIKLKKTLSRMNTIIVVFDSARADHFSLYGHLKQTTPHIDDFSKNSLIFNRAYCEALTTRCSISTLFTGYPLMVTSVFGPFSKLPIALPTLAQHLKSKNIYTKGFNGMGSIASDFGFDKGFDNYFDLFREKSFYRKSQDYIPHLFPWVEKNSNNQFFLYLHFKEPHSIYKPIPKFKGLFSDSCKEKIAIDKREYKQVKNITPGQIQYVRACYDETLASADEVFGQFIQKLKNLNLLEKSIIIVTSDHGEYLGEKKVFGHGINFHEPGIHIPLIIHLPNSLKNDFSAEVNSLVKMTDIYKTLSEIYNFDTSLPPGEGKSLLPLFNNPSLEINQQIIISKRGTPGHCIIINPYKLIFFEQGKTELYNLSLDPFEENNLYSSENIRANFMIIKLKKWLLLQKNLKEKLLGKNSFQNLKRKAIPKKTIESLKTLGYIND